jgi:hypothetical protein
MVWFLAWTPFALGHWLNLFHTSYLDYPAGVNLARNTSVPLLGLIAAPVTLLIGPVASFNFLLRLAFFSSATSMFLVLRTFCRRSTAAFLGALVYAFGPYLASQDQGGAHLTFAFEALPPIIMWCLYELIVTQKRRPVRMGLLLGVLAGAQAYIEPEVLAEIAVVTLIGVAVGAVLHPTQVRLKARHLALGLGTAAGVLFLIGGDLVWWMCFAPGHLSGPAQPTNVLQSDANDLLSPIVPTSRQLVAPGSLAQAAARFVAGNFTENGGYLGIPFIAAWIATAITLRRDAIVRVTTGLAAIAFVISLGSRLTIDGHQTSIPLPEAVFAHLPLLDNTVPARYALLVLLCSCVALSIGLDRALGVVASVAARHRRELLAGIGVLATVVVVSVAPRLPFRSTGFEWPASTPSLLSQLPAGSVVLTYPYPYRRWDETMVWQAQDQMSFRIIGGYAYVQGSGGSQWWPPLVYPNYVQEFLVEEQDPAGDYYPSFRTASGPTGGAALCKFLSLESVDAVVWWNAGDGAGAVKAYFLHTLGRPALDENGVLLWDHASWACN